MPAHRLQLSPRAQGLVAFGAVLVVVAVVVALVLGLRSGGQRGTALPPTPPSPHTSVSAPSSSSASRSSAPKTPFHCAKAATHGGADTPSQICIPAIRVDASIMQLGLNADHTVQVPSLAQVGRAGWYRYSAAPGLVGPTVILGHVDSAQYGEGVFFRLGSLRPGDTVAVTRDDGKVATFVVNRVTEVAKSAFPSQQVYGPTSGPALRLVTCGGRFDSATGNYLDNIIAWGSLRSVR